MVSETKRALYFFSYTLWHLYSQGHKINSSEENVWLFSQSSCLLLRHYLLLKTSEGMDKPVQQKGAGGRVKQPCTSGVGLQVFIAHNAVGSTVGCDL